MTLDTALFSHLIGDHGLAFTANAGTDQLTAAGHTRKNGDKMQLFSTGALPGGLTAGSYYFVRDLSGSSFRLSATPGGAAIDITSAGSGTHTLGTAVSALCGKNLYPNQAPHTVVTAAAPYIVYQQISGAPGYHFVSADGLYTARLQFDVYSTTKAVALQVRDALFAWLSGFSGSLGAEALDTRLVEFEGDADGYLDPRDASERGVHRRTLDCFIVHAVAVPAFA